MATPTVNNMPDVPVRGEGFAIFQPESLAWVKALTPLRDDLNAFGSFIESWQTELEGYKADSAQAVSDSLAASDATVVAKDSAESEVVRASDAADLSEGYADDARDASILAASNAGIPSLSGNAGNVLTVDNAETSAVLSDIETFIVGDISRAPEGVLNIPSWLLCDGSAYDTAVYADLYAVLGSATLPNISPEDDEINYYIKTGL